MTFLKWKILNLQLLMLSLNINNETSQLNAVIVGIANDFGGTPSIDKCYDPKSKEHVRSGFYPLEKNCVLAIENLVAILKKYNVNVYRPKNIKGLNQIFSRDIAFVIENKIVLPNIIKDRSKELDALGYIINKIDNINKIKMPKGARVEGGDVILCNDYIFVGYSESNDFEKYQVSRTNRDGLNFLEKTFPHKKVRGFELIKSDNEARKNVLHLDCCFQPIGKKMAILFKEGFKNNKDVNFLINYFGLENIINVNGDEMYNMYPNLFSISENIIISDRRFISLNCELRKRDFIVEEVDYTEIAKMSGLFRCSTLPLNRKL